MITLEQFKKLYPNSKNPEEIVAAFEKLLPENNINSPIRIAAFISQCGHESAGWRVFEENLNYSASALTSLFGKYFKDLDVNDFHRKPEKIANVIYANRMGNYKDDDGYKFRGRGPIQLTGRNNYEKFDSLYNKNIIDNPEIVAEDMDVALLSAIWYWNANNLNKYADSCDFKILTKRINGGYHGYEDRLSHFKSALYELIDTSKLIKIGSFGDEVKVVQFCLGTEPDGIFGKNTKEKVMQWQETNNLSVDGIIGPNSFKRMLT